MFPVFANVMLRSLSPFYSLLLKDNKKLVVSQKLAGFSLQVVRRKDAGICFLPSLLSETA